MWQKALASQTFLVVHYIRKKSVTQSCFLIQNSSGRRTTKKENEHMQNVVPKAASANCIHFFFCCFFKREDWRAAFSYLRAQTPPSLIFFRWFSRRFCRNWSKTCLHLSFRRCFNTLPPPHFFRRAHTKTGIDANTLYARNLFPSQASSRFLSALPATVSQSSLVPTSFLGAFRARYLAANGLRLSFFYFLILLHSPGAMGGFSEDYSFGCLKWYVFRKIVRITLLIPLFLLLIRTKSFAMP